MILILGFQINKRIKCVGFWGELFCLLEPCPWDPGFLLIHWGSIVVITVCSIRNSLLHVLAKLSASLRLRPYLSFFCRGSLSYTHYGENKQTNVLPVTELILARAASLPFGPLGKPAALCNSSVETSLHSCYFWPSPCPSSLTVQHLLLSFHCLFSFGMRVSCKILILFFASRKFFYFVANTGQT